MIKNAMNTNLRISLVLMVAAMFGTTAWADGTHGSTFKVKNDSGGTILVYTYNGNDSKCLTAHREYVIDNGGERTAKCHGNGTGRCKFTVFKGRSYENDKITECPKDTCNCGFRTDDVNKGETCTITGRELGDYNCE